MDKNINRKLIVAYSKLIRKETEKISVTALCEKAEVSRATFYIYYADLDAFREKLSDYIVDKFFKQAILILSCDDAEFISVVRKENHLFDEYELEVLKYMIKGTNYIDFASIADSYYIDKNNNPVCKGIMWENYKDDIDLFSRGYLPILVDGLTDYNEKRFRRDMKHCRALFRSLYEYMQEGLQRS